MTHHVRVLLAVPLMAVALYCAVGQVVATQAAEAVAGVWS